MKILQKVTIIALCAACVVLTTQARPYFNKSKDILIAQFDSKPDPDDIHAQAALGCMLVHSDYSSVNYYAVAGAIGKQGGEYINSRGLFAMAFGTENTDWTDASQNWWGSVSRIRAKAKAVLNNGGKVWVMEAGQSNITADWVWGLINNDNISASTVKANVIVVQHSDWNENETTSSDLSYVKDRTTYYYLDDGNAPYGETSWGDHGPYSTPEYRNKSTTYLSQAKSSQNAKADQLWTEADRIIDTKWPNGYPHTWSHIHFGGVDFSDCVEAWWILDDTVAGNNVSGFWSKFVTNSTGGGGGGQSPYGGSNRTWPGRIEAEHYDLGGEGVAYHDTTAGNSGGQFRSDRVDIAARDGSHVVGWIAGGEWLEYTIDVTGGQYTLKARVACPASGKRIVVKVDGNTLRTINLPNTGSWSVYQDVSISGVWISSKNDRILRLEFPDGGYNVNWIQLQ